MKTKICLVGLLLAMSVPAWATLVYSAGTLAGSSSIGIIPDNNKIGTMNLSGMSFTASGLGSSISDMTLTLQLTGTSTSVSDLTSAYLRLGDGNPTDGGGYYGLTSLLAANSSAVSSGTPFSVSFTTTGDPFVGANPNATWTLFFADTVPGDTTTLNGWSLNITAVPEPVNLALGVFGVGFAILPLCRFVRMRKQSAGA